MLILAIETTGPKASAALIDEAGVLTEKISPDEMNHLKGLTLLLDELLDERGVTINDVSHIAVSEGPGSFTGIRIGVSTARALAQVTGTETIGVPTLESFVYNRADSSGIVCPVFDARREQVYSGAFAPGEDGRPLSVIESKAWAPRELFGRLADLAAGRPVDAPGTGSQNVTRMEYGGAYKGWPVDVAPLITFFGDGVSLCRAMIAELQTAAAEHGVMVDTAEAEESFQRASSVARLASAMLKDGCQKPFSALLPVYMRKAEAERKLEERLAAERLAAELEKQERGV
ncbi:MAG: tRNA (adenosine(37)-N6)-threonylcarbamoyltransferase complex dimerization subunit type 1 TsaB [Clostridiales Family XIII bacterium]|jgi:tRNA threonylcarbamoyladenosine biosynthesis protein TsaB|nr:tRNA (adenosine(37)-N6)-threonylcarbamoyltransferase complex dimerization subunit type 1 TsaB [Clostridiales Family XIII bacterium]